MSDARLDEHLLAEASQLVLVSADGLRGTPTESRLTFAYDDGVVYLLARPDDDWYRNLQKDRGVVVRIRHRGFRGQATLHDKRQRAQVAEQIAALFKKKYGASAPAARDLKSLLPVTIQLQF